MVLHGLDFCEDTYDDIVELTGLNNYFFQEKIEDIDFAGKKFGLITLWGVLEHLVDPVNVISKCSSILAEDGVMLLLFPNPQSRAIKILGVNTPTLNPRAHVNMYGPESFKYICDKAGLRIESRFQELPVIDLMYPYVCYTEQYISDLVRFNECYYDVYFVRGNSS